MEITIGPICLNCQHFDADVSWINRCKAYPKGIPAKFMSEGEKHTSVVPDQAGEFVFVKWEPVSL